MPFLDLFQVAWSQSYLGLERSIASPSHAVGQRQLLPSKVGGLTFASLLLFQDGRLTKEEIVDKYDLFVGSQATDFGEALVRHDEF